MASSVTIKAAGEYLLSILRVEGTVSYSRFYNHAPGTDLLLVEGIWPFLEAQPVDERGDLDESHRRDLIDESHLFIEWAAWQLKDYGAVRITFTDAVLPDDEPDFRIELTERGQELARGEETFRFHGLGSGFDASQASQWLIDFAYHNSDLESTFPFDTVAQVGHTDGGVKVTDEDGNEYPPGTRPYDWAFEVSLWHHARGGNVELVFGAEDQQQLWTDFLTTYPRQLFQHGEFPTALRTVSYRLTDRAMIDVEAIRHVGWIGRE